MSATTSSKPQNAEERLQLIRIALVLYRQRKIIAAASVGCALLAFVKSRALWRRQYARDVDSPSEGGDE